MEPVNKDVFLFNSKSLETAKVSNSWWGLVGNRVVILKDLNNKTHTLSLEYLDTLAKEKINVAQSDEEKIDALKFQDRIISLDQKSKGLSSYFEYSQPENEESQSQKDERAKVSRLISDKAKATIEGMRGIEMRPNLDGSLAFDLNINQIDYLKMNELLADLLKYSPGNIEIKLLTKTLNTNLEVNPFSKQEIPDKNGLLIIIKNYGKNIQSLKIPEYLIVDKEFTDKIADSFLHNIDFHKDRLITLLDQYQLKNEPEEIEKLREFILENREVIKSTVKIDATDPKNALRRQKINDFAQIIRIQFENNKEVNELADEIDSYIAAAFFEVSDIVQNIYANLDLDQIKFPNDKIGNHIIKELKDISSVSPSFQLSKEEFGVQLYNRGFTFLQSFGAKTADEAIIYVKKFNLERINLDEFLDFDENHLQQLANCNIHTLGISYRNEKIEHWPEMRSVKNLKIFSANEASVNALVDKFPQLEYLEIDSWTHLSAKNSVSMKRETLDLLLKNCHILKSVNLRGSLFKSGNYIGLLYLRKSYPNIKNFIFPE